MRPGFFLREALRALRRNAVPSFAAMATVLVTVLVLGVFIPVVQATTGAANEVRAQRDRRRLPQDATPRQADVERVERVIATRRRTSRRVAVRLQAAGLPSSERKAQPAGLSSCSAPTRCRTRSASRPTDPDNIGAIRDALAAASPLGGRPRRSTRRSTRCATARSDTNKILSATRVVKLTMALLAVLLVARLDAADRQHDPALALRAPPRGRGDEARRRDRLVHPLAVRARGHDRRRARRRRWPCCCSAWSRSRSSIRWRPTSR